MWIWYVGIGRNLNTGWTLSLLLEVHTWNTCNEGLPLVSAKQHLQSVKSLWNIVCTVKADPVPWIQSVRRCLSLTYFELRNCNLNKTNTFLILYHHFSSGWTLNAAPLCRCAETMLGTKNDIWPARSAVVKRGIFHCTCQVNDLHLCIIIQLTLLHRKDIQACNRLVYRELPNLWPAFTMYTVN
jgi:hypothetical protein